jgi:hypothetical protein
MLSRGRSMWRLAASVVAAIEVAAVTFVPAVHPFLHDHPAGGAAVRASVARPVHGTGERWHAEVCLACLASPGLAVPADLAPDASPRVLCSPLPAPPAADVPAARVGLANCVRAPPFASPTPH